MQIAPLNRSAVFFFKKHKKRGKTAKEWFNLESLWGALFFANWLFLHVGIIQFIFIS